MGTGTKIITLVRRQAVRRTVPLSSGPRPDIQSVLDMLQDIDPDLMTRFTPQTSEASEQSPAPLAPDLPIPRSPANCVPDLPLPDSDARARALTSVIFPEGSSKILMCTLSRSSCTMCLR